MSISEEQYVSEYLKRIDYYGDLTPSLAALVELHRRHLYRVPFENLDLLKDNFEPDLSREYLFGKIVRRQRGGICYELNTAFYYLLTAMGFNACQISGSVQPGENMFSHVATLVRFPVESWLVDVGFGDSYLPPVKIGQEATLVSGINYYMDFTDPNTAEVMRRRPGMLSERMYTICLTPRIMSDYFDRFRWASAKGNTIFSQRHICALHTADKRFTLRRGVLTVEQNGQVIESRSIAPGADTERCLREYFGLA